MNKQPRIFSSHLNLIVNSILNLRQTNRCFQLGGAITVARPNKGKPPAYNLLELGIGLVLVVINLHVNTIAAMIGQAAQQHGQVWIIGCDKAADAGGKNMGLVGGEAANCAKTA